MGAVPPVIAKLIAAGRLNALGPGQPDPAVSPNLLGLTVEKAFAPATIHDRGLAEACLAGLWLYHDYLDESHKISQDLASAEGSYWHALMHRREPDFWNSKYWFRRVGRHPIFENLAAAASSLAAESSPAVAFLTRCVRWDPCAFVDLCEASLAENAPCHDLCRQVQRVEWRLLFDYCLKGALG